MSEVTELIYAKTNIGGLFFDAVIESEHTTKLIITKHPVQSGSNVSDHSVLEPAELTMKIKMSDVASSFVSGQFDTHYTRSVSAYQALKELQATRVPFSVHTRLNSYKNMLIETLVAPDDNKTLFGLEATVSMKELMVAEVQTVKVSRRKHVTTQTVGGTRSTREPDATTLYSMIKNGGSITQSLGIGGTSASDDIVSFANRYIGGRYVMGGTNLNTGVDCATFVQQVFKQFGVSLPSTATEQSMKGTPIPYNQLQSGDLIFFSGTYATPKPISHVAIYRGDGTMVHAANEQRGIVAETVSAYWKEHFNCARRMK